MRRRVHVHTVAACRAHVDRLPRLADGELLELCYRGPSLLAGLGVALWTRALLALTRAPRIVVLTFELPATSRAREWAIFAPRSLTSLL